MSALGIVAAVLAIMGIWFLLVGIVRLVSTWIEVKYIYAIIGGLFVIVGALLWSRRTPKEAA
jgi:putative Ca2+/H+ antiporter (TMEM165/GDT1 family)